MDSAQRKKNFAFFRVFPFCFWGVKAIFKSQALLADLEKSVCRNRRNRIGHKNRCDLKFQNHGLVVATHSGGASSFTECIWNTVKKYIETGRSRVQIDLVSEGGLESQLGDAPEQFKS